MEFYSITYVASPYSHVDKQVEAARYECAIRFTAWLVAVERKVAISPIVHCRPLAEARSLPGDAAWWEFYNESLMNACDNLAVLCLPWWEESKGVAAEIAYFTDANLPIKYYKIGDSNGNHYQECQP